MLSWAWTCVLWLEDTVLRMLRYVQRGYITHATQLAARVRSAASKEASTSRALERARALRAPRAEATRRGDVEHADWWAEYDALLAEAWVAYGRGDDDVYRLRREALDPAVASVFDDTDAATALGSLRAVLTEVAPGVYAFPLLSASFCEALLTELTRIEDSGIPMRR